MRNLLFVILTFVSFNIFGQGNSPKEVFQLLDKAYTAKDTVAARSLYYQNSSDDKRLVTIDLKFFLMKPQYIAFKNRIIKTYNKGALKNQLLSMFITMGSIPYYFKEKSDSAEITITDDKANSIYKDPEGMNPADFFIKVNNKWYLDPKNGQAVSDVAQTESLFVCLESILREGNKLLDQKVSKEVFIAKLQQYLK